MSYVLACRELGGDCDFVAAGATPTQVKRAVWRHVREDHADPVLTPGMRVELDRRMDGLLSLQMH